MKPSELTPQRRNALEVAAFIDRLAKSYGDDRQLQSMLAVTAARLRTFRLPRAEQKQILLDLIAAEGGLTVQELVTATNWPEKHTLSVIEDLKGDGRIKAVKAPTPGRGRPQHVFMPAD